MWPGPCDMTPQRQTSPRRLPLACLLVSYAYSDCAGQSWPVSVALTPQAPDPAVQTGSGQAKDHYQDEKRLACQVCLAVVTAHTLELTPRGEEGGGDADTHGHCCSDAVPGTGVGHQGLQRCLSHLAIPSFPPQQPSNSKCL